MGGGGGRRRIRNRWHCLDPRHPHAPRRARIASADDRPAARSRRTSPRTSRRTSRTALGTFARDRSTRVRRARDAECREFILERPGIGPPIPELLPASSATDPGTLAKPADASASPVTITWRSPANAIAPPEPAAKPAPALAPASTPTRKINVNRAPAAELELLPDVGPALAARILDHRAKHGAFKSLEDLDAVSGIGPKTLEKLKDRIVFADPAPVPAPAPR
jgi:competence ComEA-like helix-hairpin-helix protein